MVMIDMSDVFIWDVIAQYGDRHLLKELESDLSPV